MAGGTGPQGVCCQQCEVLKQRKQFNALRSHAPENDPLKYALSLVRSVYLVSKAAIPSPPTRARSTGPGTRGCSSAVPFSVLQSLQSPKGSNLVAAKLQCHQGLGPVVENLLVEFNKRRTLPTLQACCCSYHEQNNLILQRK